MATDGDSEDVSNSESETPSITDRFQAGDRESTTTGVADSDHAGAVVRSETALDGGSETNVPGGVEGTDEYSLDGRNVGTCVGTCVASSSWADCGLGAVEIELSGAAAVGPDVARVGMLVYGCGDGEPVGVEEGPEVSETGIVVDACAVGKLVGVAVTVGFGVSLSGEVLGGDVVDIGSVVGLRCGVVAVGLCDDGIIDGSDEGDALGNIVGIGDGAAVGSVGCMVGSNEGVSSGAAVGLFDDGVTDGSDEGDALGNVVGVGDGAAVGSVGCMVGSNEGAGEGP